MTFIPFYLVTNYSLVEIPFRAFLEFETADVFARVFFLMFDIIYEITGKRMQFSFADGKGIETILVDGDMAQVMGIGRALMKWMGGRPDLLEKNIVSLGDYVTRVVIVCEVHRLR